MRPRWLALFVALAPACTPVSCEAPPAEPASAPSIREGEWPRAAVADLALATPATELVLRRDRATVTNAALVATWPAAALERARASTPAGDAEWPRVEASVDAPTAHEASIPGLAELLVRARSAERAASEGGTGAGAFNLRVASDVPFVLVERALFTAARAGYVEPRIVLSAGEVDRMLPWPAAPPRAGLTREQIEGALRGEPLPVATSAEPRATLDARSLALEGCELDGALDLLAIERCAARTGSPIIALEVDRDTRFDRVAAVLQALARSFDSVRVRSRAAR